MTIPTLKRVRISSAAQLRSWLGNHAGAEEDVLVVTVRNPGSAKHVTRDEIAGALAAHGWQAGFAYTLEGGLRGQVAHPARR